ncbi:nucleotidyltransferase [Hydrogenispora ethanolica]|uniref:Nucleotidyltransferase n=1 Tax=Hydrogenispora ethanolica TaxID=1082276 RepID=A0A4R1S5T3_HYDET|nr:nucleotidyltransferase domain-containing protein [Hydrogenispora ethanolica]TCL74130.1 nucleotidyltransferase [Hydrogenispora ethanolica]
MAQIPENINLAIREYVSELSKEIPVQKAVLFGSYARGNYDRDSDVDLAIFSDYFAGSSRIEGIKFLLARARKYNHYDFQPIPFTYQDYIEREGFVAEVLKEGVEIV